MEQTFFNRRESTLAFIYCIPQTVSKARKIDFTLHKNTSFPPDCNIRDGRRQAETDNPERGGERVSLRITKDKRVFLNSAEIDNVLSVTINLDGLRDPEVLIRVSVDTVSIESYASPMSEAILADASKT